MPMLPDPAPRHVARHRAKRHPVRLLTAGATFGVLVVSVSLAAPAIAPGQSGGTARQRAQALADGPQSPGQPIRTDLAKSAPQNVSQWVKVLTLGPVPAPVLAGQPRHLWSIRMPGEPVIVADPAPTGSAPAPVGAGSKPTVPALPPARPVRPPVTSPSPKPRQGEPAPVETTPAATPTDSTPSPDPTRREARRRWHWQPNPDPTWIPDPTPTGCPSPTDEPTSTPEPVVSDTPTETPTGSATDTGNTGAPDAPPTSDAPTDTVGTWGHTGSHDESHQAPAYPRPHSLDPGSDPAGTLPGPDARLS